jgi:hypothetical protein
MPNTFKTIFGIAALVAAFFLFWSQKSGCTARKDLNEIKAIAGAAQDTGKRWTDHNGQKHLTKKVEEGAARNTDVFTKAQMDSVCKLRDIARKQLRDYVKANIGVSGGGQTEVKYITLHDTVAGLPIGWKGQYFEWADTFTFVKAWVDLPHMDTCRNPETGAIDSCLAKSKATVAYNVNVPVEWVGYWRRKHRFLFIRYGKKIGYVDITSKNPNATIIDLTALKNE